MSKKNITIIFSLVLLIICLPIETLGSTLMADSYQPKIINKGVKRCDTCGKTIPADIKCPFCNR